MAKGKSPTARSLERLRAEGFVAQVVEQTIPRCFIKRDFIGCIDIIAFNGTETIGVQATSGSNHAARRTKALAIPELKTWTDGPNRHFEVWSWAKPAKARKWELRRERLVPTNPGEIAEKSLRSETDLERYARRPDFS
jgi:hypothetical protein